MKTVRIISNKDYDGAWKYCCLEHTEVIVGEESSFVTDYETIALGGGSEDENLAMKKTNTFKTKYYNVYIIKSFY